MFSQSLRKRTCYNFGNFHTRIAPSSLTLTMDCIAGQILTRMMFPLCPIPTATISPPSYVHTLKDNIYTIQSLYYALKPFKRHSLISKQCFTKTYKRKWAIMFIDPVFVVSPQRNQWYDVISKMALLHLVL